MHSSLSKLHILLGKLAHLVQIVTGDYQGRIRELNSLMAIHCRRDLAGRWILGKTKLLTLLDPTQRDVPVQILEL
jgi:hypothetical protein